MQIQGTQNLSNNEFAEFKERCYQGDEALLVYDQMIKLNQNNSYYQQKKNEYLKKNNRIYEAVKVRDSLIQQFPTNSSYKEKKAAFLEKYMKLKKADN